MPDKPITTSAELVEYLFTNGIGQKATRLLLFDVHALELGGWSKAAIAAKVNELVESALSVERKRLQAQFRGLAKES